MCWRRSHRTSGTSCQPGCGRHDDSGNEFSAAGGIIYAQPPVQRRLVAIFTISPRGKSRGIMLQLSNNFITVVTLHTHTHTHTGLLYGTHKVYTKLSSRWDILRDAWFFVEMFHTQSVTKYVTNVLHCLKLYIKLYVPLRTKDIKWPEQISRSHYRKTISFLLLSS